MSEASHDGCSQGQDAYLIRRSQWGRPRDHREIVVCKQFQHDLGSCILVPHYFALLGSHQNNSTARLSRMAFLPPSRCACSSSRFLL